MDAEEIEGLVRVLRGRAGRDDVAADAAELIEDLRAENMALRHGLTDLMSRIGIRSAGPGDSAGSSVPMTGNRPAQVSRGR